MDLRLLRYFAAVSEHGTVHAAADAIHITQPSLSRQIRRLEHELGFELFERTARGLVLSAAGRAFLPVAHDLLMRARRAEAVAASIAGGAAMNLTVAAAFTTMTDIIAPFIIRTDSGRNIGNVTETLPEHVYRTLTDTADFAVGTHLPGAHLRHRVVATTNVWAQFHESHRFAGASEVSLDELVHEPLIVMSRAHRVRQVFDDAVNRAGLAYTAVVETESTSLAAALASANRGIGIMTDDSRNGLHSAAIHTDSGPLNITLYGVWDPSHYAAARIQQCLDDLAEFVAILYP